MSHGSEENRGTSGFELERERGHSEFKYNRVLFLDKRRKDYK